MDGVLFDSQKSSNDYYLESYPTLTETMMLEVLCGNFYEEFEKMKLAHRPKEESAEEKINRKKDYFNKKENSPLYVGIEAMLDKLHKAGNILAINSNAVEENCLALLNRTGIIKYFDYIATAKTSKSKVEKFKIIAEKYGASGQEIIFVTDTLGDVREADVAGIPTIAVTWGAHDQKYFSRENHENLVAVVDTIEDLEKIINNH